MNADERGLKTGRCAIASLLLFTGSLGATEIWTRWGSVEVSRSDSSFRLREGSREWIIDLFPILAKNCGRICEGEPSSPCPGCAPTFYIIAWDEHYRRVYFGIALGLSWDKPWAIYGYSLKTHRITQFAGTDAAHLEYGTVSLSGRYLAYVKMHHRSAAGPCRSQTDIEVVDLWNRRIGNPAVPFDSEGCAIVSGLKWSSRSELEYGGSTYRSSGAAIPGTMFSGRIEVGFVVFH